MKVLDAGFLTSAAGKDGWPDDSLPEIAFVGRSNVGKSSLLNRLAERKGLARVSSTPGRTRLLNFFDLQVEVGGGKRLVRFCDLPGYGFAKVSKAERAKWGRMIEGYLKERRELRAVVLITDARVGPTDDDRQMLHWLYAFERRPIVIATKLDKFPKAKRIPRLQQIGKDLSLGDETLIGFSSEDGTGKFELWETILDLAADQPS